MFRRLVGISATVETLEKFNNVMDNIPSPKTRVWEVRVEGEVLIRKLFSFIVDKKPTKTEMEVIQQNQLLMDVECDIQKMFVTGITYENVIKIEALDYLLSEEDFKDTTSLSHEIITIHGYRYDNNCLIPYAERFWAIDYCILYLLSQVVML
ncbi:MAG: hypothetical protein ACT6RN_27710 [Agrobacterium sp.]|uniref:hypothetical protein n=1 Tax=Agrobacterium sp. TaxID=361 RepID=UPI004037F00C